MRYSWVDSQLTSTRRYLRARKFDVAGAYGQFTDTEKWYKENRIEELYDHFDVDFYERARLMVRYIIVMMLNELTDCSILNGPVTAIAEAFPSTSM